MKETLEEKKQFTRDDDEIYSVVFAYEDVKEAVYELIKEINTMKTKEVKHIHYKAMLGVIKEIFGEI